MQERNSQKGRSMIEMIAVLAIIGIITVGAIAGINQGFVKYRTSKTFTEIRAINQGIASMYAYRRYYTSALDMPEACNSRVFPSGCDDTGLNMTAVNPFGGFYEYEGLVCDEDGNCEGNCGVKCTSMRISASGVPAAACQELMNLEWGKYLRGNAENSMACLPRDEEIQTFSIIMD